jgi:hypothetical protein
MIRLGDKLEVQVAKVDTAKKQVDFRLAAKPADAQKMPLRPQNRPKQYQLPVPSSSGRDSRRGDWRRRR